MKRKVAGALVLLLLPSAATPASKDRKVPTFGTSVTIASLPVFVTDGDGRAVPDLRAEDFEVEDDGKPAAIVGFTAFDANDPDLSEKLEDAPAARRQFLLLFDASFTPMHGLAKAREAGLEFISRRLAPTDLVGVAVYSSVYGMKSLVKFTADHDQARRAVDSLGAVQIDRQADALGLAYDLRDVGSLLADTVRTERNTANEESIRSIQVLYQRAERSGYRDRVLNFIAGLGELAQGLEVVQGRKQVILFSSGFDESTLVGNQGQAAARDGEATLRGRVWEVGTEERFGDSDIRRQMDEALRGFARSDAVVHAIDLGGLRARGDLTLQTPETSRPVGGRESLSRIADLSGGRLFKDTNDPSLALGEVLEMSRRYYLLAFEPTSSKQAGRYHKLKVRVKRKGVRLAHRSGYFERKAYDELTPMAREFEAAEIIAKGVERGEIDVHSLALPYRSGGGPPGLFVVLDVDPSSLGAGPGNDTIGLEVYGYALDSTGKVADFIGMMANVDGSKVGDRLRNGLQCQARFTLPPGSYDIRFLLRDPKTGRSGTSWLQVTMPSFETAGLSLLPPLFMAIADERVILRARSAASSGEAEPFRVGKEDFAPRSTPEMKNGRSERICLLAYDGGRGYNPAAMFDIQPQLLDAAGAPVPLGVEIVRSAARDNYRWFVLSLRPEGLAPGEYTLRARLHDPDSGRTSESYRKVSIE